MNPLELKEPAFRIGQVPVEGDLVLAPMSGFSDLPFRSLCRRFGSALSYTEFVSAKEVVHGPSLHVRRALAFLPWERPVVFQIFDSDEHRLVEGAQQIAERRPDVVDVNMGCSVPKVAGRGAGAALLREPDKIARIFAALSRTLPCPVTGKIRLGWDRANRNYLDIVRAMQENGAALITVHARTRDQGYSGHADWEAIAAAVAVSRIPVVGNGDVQSVGDIARMKSETGCTAVMIGRAAIGNPWIFQRRDRNAVPLAEKLHVIRYHYRLMEDFYGEALASTLMRKHLGKYLADYPGIRQVRPSLVSAQSKPQVYKLLDQIQSALENCDLRHRQTGLPPKIIAQQ